MYSLEQLQKAKDQLIASAINDLELAEWLALNTRLEELIKIPEVCEYFELLHHKLPTLYANSKSIKLLQEINLTIRLQNEEDSKLKGVNVHGQFY